MSSLAERYATVKAALPPHVTLVAVSKTRSVDEIKALYDLGQRHFGENYPQELREKAPLLPSDIRWHFIGHLQRSNVKHVLPHAHLIHGVDSVRLLDEIQKRAIPLGRTVDVLLQVHIAQEESKHGFAPDEVRQLVLHGEDPAHRWPDVRVRGLMGMATNTDDIGQVSAEFRSLHALFTELRTGGPFPAEQFNVLSMGMSGDARQAIAAGSTMVRIGTALFGGRA
jgi:pyridoxal phosphate enzyme (YggS family)